MEQAYSDFAKSKPFNLIWPGTPIDAAHETLPEALDQLTFRKRGFCLTEFDSSDDLRKVRNPESGFER